MIMMVMRVVNMMTMMIVHWGGAMRGRNCSTSYYFYHLHQCVHQTSVGVSPPKISHIEIIIITRPKPAYGRRGLVGWLGQDTDQAGTFWGLLNVSLRASGAQLGF